MTIGAGISSSPVSRSGTRRTYKKIRNQSPMPDIKPGPLRSAPPPAAACKSAFLVTFFATEKSHSHQPAKLAAKRLLKLKSNLIQKPPHPAWCPLRIKKPSLPILITGGKQNTFVQPELPPVPELDP